MSAQVQHQPPTWNRPAPLPPPVPLPPACLSSQLGSLTSSNPPSATLTTKAPPPHPLATWTPQPLGAPPAAPVPLPSPCAPAGKSLDEYRQQLQWIYSRYKPDNVPKVDYLLQKYRGQEDLLYGSVCQKYGIDEKMPLSMMVPQAGQLLRDAPLVGSCAKSMSMPNASAAASWNIQTHPAGLNLTTLQLPPPPLISPSLPAAYGSGAFCKQSAVPQGFAPLPPQLGMDLGTQSYMQVAATPRPVIEAPQPRKMQQVVEWDPATGKYIPSVAELDAELEALLGIGVAPSPPPAEPARLDPPTATPMLIDSAMLTAPGATVGVAAAALPTLTTSTPLESRPDEIVLAHDADAVRALDAPHADEMMDPALMDSMDQMPYAALLDAIDEIDGELLGEASGFFKPLVQADEGDDSSSSASSESEDSGESDSSQPQALAAAAPQSAVLSSQPIVPDAMAAEKQAVASLWDALRGVGSDDEDDRPPSMSTLNNGAATGQPPTSNVPLAGSQDPYEALRQAMADGSDSDGEQPVGPRT